MITGPKYKICKRLGAAVFEQCHSQRFTVAQARQKTARSGGRRPKAATDYKRQLLEKQKMRYLYGLRERQLSRYVAEAAHARSEGPARALMTRIESRLDNVVYRLGFAKTRALARQLVSHGHIVVDGKKVTVPSYRLAPGEAVAVRPQSADLALFATAREDAGETPMPAWLEVDRAALAGHLTAVPLLGADELLFDLEQVLEYYSR